MTPEVRELDELVRISQLACALIREHYTREIHVEYKVGDDPVTATDRAANELVCAELERTFPGVPIVAEENPSSTFDVRRDATACFFVDPLDGTREYVAKNGEFAVMIGLARDARAALGVVAAPNTGRIFAGGPNVPSFEIARDGSKKPIHARDVRDPKEARAVVSRSRATPATLDALARLGVVHIDKLGSAGLKVVAVACGEADLWIQTGGAGMLWDACGPEAIALGAGVRYALHDRSSPDYSRGPLELSGLVVAATDALLDAALAAVR